MMRDTVGGRRKILSHLQSEIEDEAVAVVEIETRFALRDLGKYLNPEEVKAPEIAKMC